MRKNKILSLLLCATMVLGVFAVPTVADAAEKEKLKLEDYRSAGSYTAPTKGGSAFAGWYYDEAFAEPVDYADMDGDAYAKFVDPDVFGVKFQYSEGTNTLSDETALRFITTVDSGNYYAVGFKVTVGDKSVELPVDTIYTSLYGYVDGESQAYQPTVFSATDSQYFAVQKITGIKAENFDKDITVVPYYETLDGTKIEGTERTISVASTAPVAEIVVDAQATNLGFTTTTADPFAVGEVAAVEGGIYVNGVLSETAKLNKTAANTYSITGVTEVADVIVKVDGKFGTATQFATVAVAFGYESEFSRWLMAKTLFENLQVYDDIHGARTDKELFLVYGYGDAVVKGQKDVSVHTDKAYTYPSVGAFIVEQGADVLTKQYQFSIYTSDYLRIHNQNVALGNSVEEGTIVTLKSGIMTNYGYGANEYPFYVEGLSVIYKDGHWATYVPAAYDVSTTLTGYANSNYSTDTGHGKMLVASLNNTTVESGLPIASSWYYPIEGGFYFNGSSTPIVMHAEMVNGLIYLFYEDHYNVSFAPSFISMQDAGVTVEEGTTLLIKGVFDAGSNQARVRIEPTKFIFLNGRWASYEEVATFTDHDAHDTHIAMVPATELAKQSAHWYSVGGGMYLGTDATEASQMEIVTVNADLAYIPYNSANLSQTYYMQKYGVELVDGYQIRVDGVFYAPTLKKSILVRDLVYEYHNTDGVDDWTIVE